VESAKAPNVNKDLDNIAKKGNLWGPKPADYDKQ
jgi:hypothetical protein